MISQSCDGEKQVKVEKLQLKVDSLIINRPKKLGEQIISHESKATLDTINGIWCLYERFSPLSKDEIINTTIQFEIKNNKITKVIDGKVVFVDSIEYVQETKSYKRYQFKNRQKDFLKYSIKNDVIYFFIGGEDGSREDYKRKLK